MTVNELAARLKPRNLRAELTGGLTTAIVSLPMALAFGVASGAGPQAGLYGAIIVGLLAAVFGGTSTLISEPTGPMTVIMTAVVTRLIAANPEQGLAMAFTVVMVAGAFQIIFGLLRLGRYITMMPYSVISGFMSGIGLLLIITQIGPLLGHPAPAGGALGAVRALPGLIAGMEWREAVLSGAALLLLFLVPGRLRRYAPPQLLVLVLGSAAGLLAFGPAAIRTIGEIPMGLPRLVVPTFTAAQATQIVVDGVVLGLLGCIDSLLTAMIADSLTREQHDSNRELIGQGIGNLVSGLAGGLPGAGATMGTVVNIQTGARSPFSAVVRALILLVVVLAVAPLLEAVPMAVLAAITVKVGFDILDWSFLGRAHHISRTATIIMYGVLLLTVFVDLIVAVAAGVFVANVLTIERLSNLPSTRVRTIDPSGDPVVVNDEEKALLEAGGGRVVLFHLSGPMIFGVAQAIAREHAAVESHAQVVVIDLAEVSILGTTVALALENVIRDALHAGRRVVVAGASEEARDRLGRLGVLSGSVELTGDRLTALRDAVSSLDE
ncbi:MAG: STAS domain-containing protein [Spirochaetes bacterium]|jgi:SulP family sulfate permease|nr:STAS domain-containing protein [Spirochaetota bacterium]